MRLTEAERKNLSATEFEESIIGVIRKLRTRENVLMETLSLAYRNAPADGKALLEEKVKQALSDFEFDRYIARKVHVGTVSNVKVDGVESMAGGEMYLEYLPKIP